MWTPLNLRIYEETPKKIMLRYGQDKILKKLLLFLKRGYESLFVFVFFLIFATFVLFCISL